jgi:hypothetical protein
MPGSLPDPGLGSECLSFFLAAGAAWIGCELDSRRTPTQSIANQKGPGSRVLHSVGYGAAASLVGGTLFTAVLPATGFLQEMANVFGGSSLAFGAIVNMIVSAFIGISYGLLFRHEAPDVRCRLGTRLRLALVVYWPNDLAAGPARWHLQLDYRNRRRIAPVACWSLDLRSCHRCYFSHPGAPPRGVAGARSAHCGKGSAAYSAGRYACPSIVALHAGSGSVTADHSGLSLTLVHRMSPA